MRRRAGFLGEGRRRGLLAIAMTGGGAAVADAEHSFAVRSADPVIVQEAQETAYHVLWELVHVFFEHPLLDDACITCDVAVQARVVALTNCTRRSRRRAREDVAIDLVEDVELGDVLLCHAGVALEKVPDAEFAGAREGSGASGPAGSSPTGARTRPASCIRSWSGRRPTWTPSSPTSRSSTRRKAEDVIELRAAIDTGAVARCAEDVRERVEPAAT